MVYTNSSWSMGQTLAETHIGDLTAWHFFAGLIAFNLLAGMWSRKVLAKKLA